MGSDSTGYKIVFVLHMLTVIVGFGGLVFNGVYAAHAKKRQAEGHAAVTGATSEVAKRAEYAVYAVPILGIGLVAMSEDQWAFDQLWVGVSLLLYIVAVGVHHGLLRPTTTRRMALEAELSGSGSGSSGAGRPPQAQGLDALDAKLATGSMVFNLLLIVIVVLMVFKPGV